MVRSPKLECTSIADCPEWFTKVYRALLARGNAERWWRETIWKEGIVPIEGDVAGAIQKVMDNHPDITAWFCKVGTRSTKHEYPVQPVMSGADAVDHLWGAKIVLESINDGTARCVCLRPWDDRINSSNELRVFCRDGRVVGVSQQACYSAVPALHLFGAEDVVAAAQRCYDDFTSKMVPAHRFPGECTFDAFLTTDSTGEVDAHLIEINAGMFGWGPAGAALFHWVLEPPPSDDDDAVFYIA